MPVRSPKEILDPDDLSARLEAIATKHGIDTTEGRAALVDLVQRTLANAKEEMLTRFNNSQKPTPYLKEHAYVMDQLITSLVNFLTDKKTSIACVAVGGYGRKELFPYSDIDLLFIVEDAENAEVKKQIEAVLYSLWDSGLQIGHAVRSVSDCITQAKADHTITANLLSARFICGDKKLFSQFESQFNKQIRASRIADFVDAKMAERKARHIKQGNSRFLLEPNVKENKGALRDLHTLHWLADYSYGAKHIRDLEKLNILSAKEARDFRRAREFLWTVRLRLHLLAGRADERLTFDRQKQIGEQLGYRTTHEHRPVERFMKRYFQVAKTVGNLTRIVCAVLEEEHKRGSLISLSRLLDREKRLDGFILKGQRLNFDESMSLKDDPLPILSLFRCAQLHDLDIHPAALQRISRNLKLIDANFRKRKDANALFMEMLLAGRRPGLTLRRLNEAGVLGKFIPEFAHVIGQMQYDMYHIYTVDEHIIHAIDTIHDIEQGAILDELPLTSEVIKQIHSRSVLYLAMLCHDIAKGKGGNHPQKGEAIAIKLAKRFGLSELHAQTVGWLVREHMIVTDIAFKRDLDDAKTITDFVGIVQSPERLRLLLILTVADIRAVGPKIWNRWKGSLLRDLYHKAEAQMGTASFRANDHAAAQVKEDILQALSHWSETDRTYYAEITSPSLWLAAPLDQQLTIAEQIKQSWATPDQPIVDYSIAPDQAITHLTITMPGHYALMRYITGALVMIGASISSARLFMLNDGTAVTLLEIQNHQHDAYADETALNKLPQHLLNAAQGSLDLEKGVSKLQTPYKNRTKGLKVEPEIVIDNQASHSHTVIEVSALDRIGLLYDICRTLSDLRITISAAHISTYGEKAVDVFYVKDTFGLKIEHETKLTEIRHAISETLVA